MSAIDLSIAKDLFPLLAATLACVICGLLGNFLVLRRLSLMGDAISHSVLPGLVIAFLIASTRSPLAMFLGAAVAGVATVVLVEVVKKLGRVEPGAAMGVVFSVLFALGVLLIERAAVRHVDLDADCVLHGQLETLYWIGAPDSLAGLWSLNTLSEIPHEVSTLALMTTLAFLFVGLLFKELRIAAFDPALATTQGFHAGTMHYLLMVFVAAATVASFSAVGSILVIAMLVCPAATARLLTDRLGSQIACSIVVAVLASVGGYLGAIAIPGLWGKDDVNAAGSIAVAAGLLLTLALALSPRHGVVTRALRRGRLARSIERDDLLAALYRAEEQGRESLSAETLRGALTGRHATAGLRAARARGLVTGPDPAVRLTPKGRDAAEDLIRRHRLWEHYLVEQAGMAPDHVHDTAERLEHLPQRPAADTATDPHGKPIP